MKEPYSIVGYVAERIDLVALLRITHPNIEDEPGEPWSAWYICFAWADKNGYKTARTGILLGWNVSQGRTVCYVIHNIL